MLWKKIFELAAGAVIKPYTDYCANEKPNDCAHRHKAKEYLWIDFDGNVYLVGNSHWQAEYYAFYISRENLNGRVLAQVKNEIGKYLSRDKVYYCVKGVDERALTEKGFVSAVVDTKKLTCADILRRHGKLAAEGRGAFNPDREKREQYKREVKRKNGEYSAMMARMK